MLADVGAGDGEGVVLADEADGVLVSPRADEGDIPGDVHPGGAEGHAGHRVLQVPQTAVVADMLPVVVGKALHAVQDQLCGVASDSAGGGPGDGPGGLLDDLHVAGLGPAVEHVGEEDGQLSQPHPAGDALPAGLGVAEVQKVQRQVHRTEARRRRGDAALHVVVELVHHHLGPVRGLDV